MQNQYDPSSEPFGHHQDQIESKIRDFINKVLQSIPRRSVLDYAGIVQHDHLPNWVIRDGVLEDVLGECSDVLHAARIKSELLQRGMKLMACEIPERWDVIFVTNGVEFRVAEKYVSVIFVTSSIFAWQEFGRWCRAFGAALIQKFIDETKLPACDCRVGRT